MLKNCYLCKTKNGAFAFNKIGYKIYQCKNCGLYFLQNETSYKKFIEKYYQKGYFNGDKKLRAYANYQEDKVTIQRNMDHYLEKITAFKKNGYLLDIGCAMGFLLELSEKKGFNSFGLDVSEYAVKIAQKKFGKKIILSSLSEAKLNKNFFDVITMFDLIEHLETPIEDLTNVKNSLKDDGILVIQTGDAESKWAKFMKRSWHFFAPPQHLFFYSRSTIEKVLSKAGFKIIKIEKDGKFISLRYLFHMMRYIKHDGVGDFLHNIVKNNFIGKLPIFLRFNDNMIIYAKKN